MALLSNGKLPTAMIATLTTLMSEGDLRLLQWAVQDATESMNLALGPERGQAVVETAYSVAREMHPTAPSLQELMAWDRQSPPPGQEPSCE